LHRKKWPEWCILDSPYLFNNSIGLPALTINTTCRNQLFYVSLFDLQTNYAKLGLKTWITPNGVIRIYLHDMQRSWTKNAIWNLNNKKWNKGCILVSHFTFNNCFGLPVFTLGTTCPNQVFYVWLVDLQDICAKLGLKSWLSPNDDIRICSHDMQRSWNKNAIWKLNSKKWRKWCILFSFSYLITVWDNLCSQ
jgi:hypothetical protein